MKYTLTVFISLYHTHNLKQKHHRSLCKMLHEKDKHIFYKTPYNFNLLSFPRENQIANEITSTEHLERGWCRKGPQLVSVPEPWDPLFWGPAAVTWALVKVCTGWATMVPPPPLTIALATPWVTTCFGPTALATDELALATRIWPPLIATACFTVEGRADPTGTPTTCSKQRRIQQCFFSYSSKVLEQHSHCVPAKNKANS